MGKITTIWYNIFMKKALLVLGLLILLIVLINHRYSFLPPKIVTLNENFTIHKWQTATFGKNKYVTYCGTQGNTVGGTGPYAAYQLNINGKRFPCTDKAIDYDSVSFGPTRPYSVEFSGAGNVVTAIIKDSNQYYQEWGLAHLTSNCKEDLPNEQKQACIEDELKYIGSPSICSQQTLVDEKTCEAYYVNAFKNMCAPQQSKEISDGVWTQEITNQDDCLYQRIVSRHLPSANCGLLISDSLKKDKCLNERMTEESFLESLKQ
jgi:hypothetical protein